MRIERPDCSAPMGWYFGPWNSDSQVAVGYANEPINEPHLHQQVTEVFLVARGLADLEVNGERRRVEAGDAVLISAGEIHTWVWGSPDFFCFALHHPVVQGDKTLVERILPRREYPHRLWPEPPIG